MSITVRIGDLPPPVKQAVITYLKETNPPFPITDDLEITVIEIINTCVPFASQAFYRIEANGLFYGSDYIEYGWNDYKVNYYNWSTDEAGEVDDTPVEKIYNILSSEDPVSKACEYLLKDNIKELEEFLQKNLPEWLRGHKFYDVNFEKTRTIDDITVKKVTVFDISGNVVELVFDEIEYELKFGDLKGEVWYSFSEKDDNFTEVKTTFKELPIIVRIFGDTGIVY